MVIGQTSSEPSSRARPLGGFVLLAMFGLLIAACVNVDVINVSELNARVRITLPDTPSGYTRLVRAGQSTSTFSEYGGTVTVTTLPDEEYRQFLHTLRDEISRRLFEEGETLSVADVKNLVERLDEVDKLVAELGRQGASCSVRTSDFATVTVIVNWDESIANWNLTCSVQNEDS